MDYTTNSKYFTKNNHLFTFIGLGIVLLGIIMMIVQFLLFGVGVAIVGVAVVVVSIGSKIKDEDIDIQGVKKNQDFMDLAKDKLDILGKETKLFQPIEISAFGFEEMDTIYTKKGSDGKQRSSVYVNTGMYFSPEMLYACKYYFSFVEEKEGTEIFKAKFADIVKAELTDEKMTDANGVIVPYTMFRITTVSGKNFCFPMKNDAESDKLADNINYQAKKMKAVG